MCIVQPAGVVPRRQGTEETKRKVTRTAEGFGGEILQQPATQTERSIDFGRGTDARGKRESGNTRGLHDVGVQSGRYSERRSGIRGRAHLRGVEQCSGTDAHRRERLADPLDALKRSGGAEGQFDEVDAAFEQRRCEGFRVTRIIDDDHGHRSGGLEPGTPWLGKVQVHDLWNL
jgi:hypothetical protein